MFGNTNEMQIDDCRLMYVRRIFVISMTFISLVLLVACSKPVPEPQAKLRVADSKIYVNDLAVSDLDSVVGQSVFLVDKLYNALDDLRENIQMYRDSVTEEMGSFIPMKEGSQRNKEYDELAANIDSIKDQPYSASLYVLQDVTYGTFIKLAYTVFQANFERLYFAGGSNVPVMRSFISKNAAQCSPYVSNVFGKKPEYKAIGLSELDRIDLLNTKDTVQSKAEKAGSRMDKILYPGGIRLSRSIKFMIELKSSGINVMAETFTAKADLVESENFLLLNEGKNETLPNIAGQRDWEGLKNIMDQIIFRLKQNQNTRYCEHVITLMLSPEAPFEEFCKLTSVIESAGSDGNVPWYREIVPGLYYNNN